VTHFPFPASGLYLVTPDWSDDEALLNAVAAALRGGAHAVQYRAKQRERSAQATREFGARLITCCHQHAVPLLINDDIALAEVLGADGVHVGRDDATLAEARARLGPRAIIGASCYDSLPRAQAAVAAGADYVAFGRFFPSRTKPSAPPARLETLTQARHQLDVPIVAIGGVLPENASTLLTAGATVLAVVSGVFDDEPEAAARRLVEVIATHSGKSRNIVFQ